MRTLDRQLAEYGEVLERSQDRVSLEEVTSPVVVIRTRPAFAPSSWGWAVGAGAIVLLIGVMALLVRGSPTSDVVDSTPITPNTVPGSPTTVPMVVPPNSVVPNSEPSAGSGPVLGFGVFDGPSGEFLEEGVWFKGALYSASRNGVYRTVDGVRWDRIPDTDRETVLFRSTLFTDGETLYRVGVSGNTQTSNARGQCADSTDVIRFDHTTDGDSWGTLETTVGDATGETGCVDHYRGEWVGAAGPSGAMFHTEFGGVPHVWTRTPNMQWRLMDTPWNDTKSGLGSVIGVPDGFLVQVDNGIDVDTDQIWWTDGDSTWEIIEDTFLDRGVLSIWDGVPMLIGDHLGPWDSPGQVTIPSVRDLDVYLNEFGVVGITSGDGQVTDVEVLYGQNLQTWVRWSIEYEPPGAPLRVIGIGDGFVVISEWGGQRILVAADTGPSR